MCGIVGARASWLQRQGFDPEPTLRRALARLRWRGRDAEGLARSGDWWLGCARLAIGPEAGRQPVQRRGTALLGVLNGAVTDARAQWAALWPRLAGRASLPNDAWLPVLAHAQGRSHAAFRGHHAFLVADGGDALAAGVDAAGEKPLWLVRDGGEVVAAASTWPALQALGVAAPRLDARAFLRRGHHGAVVAPGVAAAPRAAWPGPPAGVPATAAGLRVLVLQAVSRCAAARPPVGLCLSGGLDSSSLAAALRAVGRRVPCYQFRADGEDGGERALAAAVAAHCGHDLRPVDGGPAILDALPFLTRCHGLPLGDPSLLALHALARAAAADGVRVLLSGEGADEALLGYDRHRLLRWLPPRRVLPRWSAPTVGDSRLARVLRALALPVAADPLAELLAPAPPAFAALVLAPDAVPPVTLPELPLSWSAATRLEQVRRRELHDYLAGDLLPKVDVATLAAGVEGRCPLLDQDVVAWALARPALAVLGKKPLRAAFAGELPPAVGAQRKRGLAVPLDRWFRGDLALLDLLRQARTLARPHLRAAGVAAAIDRHRRGAAAFGRGLYLLAAYELFLRSQEEPDACA